MNLDDFKKSNSKSFLKLNPALGGLQAEGPKSTDGCKGKHPELDVGPTRVEVRCELTAYRRRLLDEHDSLPQSFKRLVDAIAADLGVPDNDPRLVWRFYQVKTDGREGCTVRIEVTHG